MDLTDLMKFATLNEILAVPILAAVAIAVITEKLVYYKRLERETARADRWERIALEALRTSAEAGVKAAEVTVDVVSAMPDPAGKRGG